MANKGANINVLRLCRASAYLSNIENGFNIMTKYQGLKDSHKYNAVSDENEMKQIERSLKKASKITLIK
jgi:hypothetical protein